jgi:hypothetical protein
MLAFYKLTCVDCNRVNMGQTGKNLHIRHKKHTCNISNNEDWNVLHIPNNGQMYSKTNDTKTLLNKQNTGWEINTKVTLYICTERKAGKAN